MSCGLPHLSRRIVPAARAAFEAMSKSSVYVLFIGAKKVGEKISPTKSEVCPGRDLNPHVFRHTLLKRTRLPITPPGLTDSFYPNDVLCQFRFFLLHLFYAFLGLVFELSLIGTHRIEMGILRLKKAQRPIDLRC